MFAVDGFTRVPALVPGLVTLRLTYNNTVLAWSLVSGIGVTDTSVVAGSVFWDEVSPGYYRVRFFPNAPGAWRLEFVYPPSGQRTVLVYDVTPPAPTPTLGLHASFTG